MHCQWMGKLAGGTKVANHSILAWGYYSRLCRWVLLIKEVLKNRRRMDGKRTSMVGYVQSSMVLKY